MLALITHQPDNTGGTLTGREKLTLKGKVNCLRKRRERIILAEDEYSLLSRAMVTHYGVLIMR